MPINSTAMVHETIEAQEIMKYVIVNLKNIDDASVMLKAQEVKS